MNMSSDNGDNKNHKEKDEMKFWGILLFGFLGATFTTATVWLVAFAVYFCRSPSVNPTCIIEQIRLLKFDVESDQMSRQSSWKGKAGGSSRTRYQEEAWKKYTRRIQEEYEEEMKRRERIRRMQNMFNRERNKYKRSYERGSEQGSGTYYQDFQRDDWQGTYGWARNEWYWHGDPSFKESGPYGGANYYRETPQATGSNFLSHHYSVLGLDRTRTNRYTDNEIKAAFRAMAMKFHPDQNQDNKEAAEAKFKEIMTSFEAIKMERKN